LTLSKSSARDHGALSSLKTIHAMGRGETPPPENRKPPPGGAWPSASESAPCSSAGDWRAYNGRGPRQPPSGVRSCRGRIGGVPADTKLWRRTPSAKFPPHLLRRVRLRASVWVGGKRPPDSKGQSQPIKHPAECSIRVEALSLVEHSFFRAHQKPLLRPRSASSGLEVDPGATERPPGCDRRCYQPPGGRNASWKPCPSMRNLQMIAFAGDVRDIL
jgi:hypothetical protein